MAQKIPLCIRDECNSPRCRKVAWQSGRFTGRHGKRPKLARVFGVVGRLLCLPGKRPQSQCHADRGKHRQQSAADSDFFRGWCCVEKRPKMQKSATESAPTEQMARERQGRNPGPEGEGTRGHGDQRGVHAPRGRRQRGGHHHRAAPTTPRGATPKPAAQHTAMACHCVGWVSTAATRPNCDDR